MKRNDIPLKRKRNEISQKRNEKKRNENKNTTFWQKNYQPLVRI
jgi:hypothetical protein